MEPRRETLAQLEDTAQTMTGQQKLLEAPRPATDRKDQTKMTATAPALDQCPGDTTAPARAQLTSFSPKQVEELMSILPALVTGQQVPAPAETGQPTTGQPSAFGASEATPAGARVFHVEKRGKGQKVLAPQRLANLSVDDVRALYFGEVLRVAVKDPVKLDSPEYAQAVAVVDDVLDWSIWERGLGEVYASVFIASELVLTGANAQAFSRALEHLLEEMRSYAESARPANMVAHLGKVAGVLEAYAISRPAYTGGVRLDMASFAFSDYLTLFTSRQAPSDDSVSIGWGEGQVSPEKVHNLYHLETLRRAGVLGKLQDSESGLITGFVFTLLTGEQN